MKARPFPPASERTASPERSRACVETLGHAEAGADREHKRYQGQNAGSPFMRAFTLIELLVVLSIIAVLVSLLLPAISLVRRSVRLSVCASNQRQLGMAFGVYSQEWEGVMPLLYNEPAKQASYYAYTALGRSGGLGLVWDAEYLDTERVFFCPGEMNGGFMHNTVYNPWPKIAGKPTRSAFNLRPVVRFFGDYVPGPTYPARFPSLGSISGKAILADTVDYESRLKSRHQMGINVTYWDGHVSMVPTSLLRQPYTLMIAPAAHSVVNNAAMDAVWTLLDK